MVVKKIKIWEYILLGCLAFCYLLIVSFSTSPLYLNNYGISDSSIFLLIGKSMTQGCVPYVDIFDHKGPVLFFIQALGWLIYPNRFGNFIIQWLFMWVNLIMIIKLTALFFEKKWGWIIIGFFLIIVSAAFCFEGGNLTEELSLPFLFISLFLSLKYMKSGKLEMHPPWYAFIYGICFTSIVFIRMNNVGLIGGIVLVIMIQLIKFKSWKNLFENMRMFLCGVFIIAFPIGIYFLINNGLEDMIYGTFLFNFMYTESLTGIRSWEKIIEFLMCVFPIIFSLMTGFIYIRTNKKNEKEIMGWLLIIISIITLVGLLLGGVFYHYFVLASPCFVLGMILGMDFYAKNNERKSKNKGQVIIICLLFLFAVGIYLNICMPTIKTNYYKTREIPQNEYNQRAQRIASIIPEEERDSVFGYSVPAGWFLITDITPCYKYFTLQEWWGLYDPQIIIKTNEMLKNNPPKWIVMASDKQTNTKIYEILSTHYQCIEEDQEVSLYRYTDD